METRPWGWYEVLFDGTYKVKRIHVLPGKRLSLQSHRHRREHWIVVEGSGRAVRGDDVVELAPGDVIIIETGQKHRLINDSTGGLEVVEIQTGTYFGEDDITRYEDDFGRV
jgi:mannose-1-phosphate guanylyltransferase/mannose-6-phosphate isomerase